MNLNAVTQPGLPLNYGRAEHKAKLCNRSKRWDTYHSEFYQTNLIHYKHSDYNSPQVSTDGAIVIYVL